MIYVILQSPDRRMPVCTMQVEFDENDWSNILRAQHIVKHNRDILAYVVIRSDKIWDNKIIAGNYDEDFDKFEEDRGFYDLIEMLQLNVGEEAFYLSSTDNLGNIWNSELVNIEQVFNDTTNTAPNTEEPTDG